MRTEKFRYNITFFAEHNEESDLVFYSTEPGENLIGPGISIIKLGGILSEFPPPSFSPKGFWDCFNPDMNFIFHNCFFKSERLLLNAIHQSSGKYLLYIAKKRPNKIFYKIAREKRKEILFVPFSSFSPSTLNKVKYMHILAGKDRRKIADRFINLKKRFKF